MSIESFNHRLINLVRQNPSIYDRTLASYRYDKGNIWHAISTRTGRTDEECRRRWRSLRDRYVREAHNTEERSKWAYFDQLAFLDDHKIKNMIKLRASVLRKRKRQRNEAIQKQLEASVANTETNVESIEEEVYGRESSSSSSSPSHGYSKESDLEKRFELLLEKAEDIVSRTHDEPANDPFLDLLTSKLNMLPPDKVEDVKLEILSLVNAFVKESTVDEQILLN